MKQNLPPPEQRNANLIWALQALGSATVGTGLLIGMVYAMRRYINPKIAWTSAKLLSGKTVIITGGNSGIGKATALDLARRQARVIIACRTRSTAEESVTEIRNVTGNDEVHYKHLDLSSFASISSFTSDILSTEQNIDILINNGGVYGYPDSATADGVEQTFGTNHLGHFYLTKLLLARIRQSDIARIISVSSGLHRNVEIELDELKGDNPTIAEVPEINDAKILYSKSKLAQIYFTSELQARYPEIHAFSVRPGLVYTSLARYAKINSVIRFIGGITLPHLMRSPEQGAMTSVYCAVEDGLEDGAYYGSCEKEELQEVAKNPEVQKLLWECSERLVERIEKNMGVN